MALAGPLAFSFKQTSRLNCMIEKERYLPIYMLRYNLLPALGSDALGLDENRLERQ